MKVAQGIAMTTFQEIVYSTDNDQLRKRLTGKVGLTGKGKGAPLVNSLVEYFDSVGTGSPDRTSL
jgi:hypothetical protein